MHPKYISNQLMFYNSEGNADRDVVFEMEVFVNTLVSKFEILLNDMSKHTPVMIYK